MLRFAPSPTADMNIGDLRVALFNYIVSKQKNEDLIVRIEDIDKEKYIEGKDTEILDILNLFGIEYTQTIYQSESIRFHTAMALQLIHEKKAFSCFCSPNWLENKKKEAKENNKAYRYDDACRDLPDELVIDNNNPFTIRIKRADETIVINDLIKGEMKFKPDTLDSFIIMNQNKIPTYNFACAVDDMINDISLVIRNENYIDDTPKQDYIRSSLNYNKKVKYAHIPILLDSDSFSVKSLLEDGYLPQAIINYLITIGENSPKEIFKMQDAIEWFKLENISDSPTRFDINMLKYINKKHLLNLDAKELSRYVGFADDEIGELAKLYLEEVSTTKELRAKIHSIFEEKTLPAEFEKEVKIINDVIKIAPYFDKYDDFINHIIKESGLKSENISKPLSILLTNTDSGLDIAKIYKYIKNYIGEIVK